MVKRKSNRNKAYFTLIEPDVQEEEKCEKKKQ